METSLVPMTAQITPNQSTTEVALAELAETARDFIHAARADNTIRAYRADIADFMDWCLARGLESLPATPATVVLYLRIARQP